MHLRWATCNSRTHPFTRTECVVYFNNQNSSEFGETFKSSEARWIFSSFSLSCSISKPSSELSKALQRPCPEGS
ncbi:hypothetical protein VTI74DRAFT_11344 [Chaetomium olivicolor]